ncbi:hypothetical protein JZU68_10515 [bacterium]|nr:hypothetical protein [bacterium]
MSIIQVTPTIRRKKKGTPVWKGSKMIPAITVASVKSNLSKFDKTIDPDLEHLKKLWSL